jgi:hypothetical protein
METCGIIEWIGLEELLHVMDNQDINYHFEIGNGDCITIIFGRYACDEHGYHEGYERFSATFQVFRRIDAQLGGISEIAEYFIIPTMFDMGIAPARAPWTDADLEEALLANGVDIPSGASSEAVLDLAEEHGIYDPYCPPDEGFAFQEIEHHLSNLIEEVKRLTWRFNGPDTGWSLE